MRDNRAYYGGCFSADPVAQKQRQLRHRANFVGTMMLFLFLFHTTLFSVIAAVLIMTGVLPPDALSAEKIQTLGMENTAYLLLYLSVYVMVMGLPMGLSCLLFRPSFCPLDLNRRVKPALFTGCVLMGMALCTLGNVVANLWTAAFSEFGIDVPNTPSMLEDEPVSLVLNFLIMAVLPALLEEFFFRGYVLQALRPFGDGWAVVLSALLFGLMHGNLTQLPFAFLLGLMFGFLAVRLENIWVGCAIHLLNNALAVVVNDWLPYHLTDSTAQSLLILLIYGTLTAAGIGVFLVMLAMGHPLFRRRNTPSEPVSVGLRGRSFFLSPLMAGSLILFLLQTAGNTQ